MGKGYCDNRGCQPLELLNYPLIIIQDIENAGAVSNFEYINDKDDGPAVYFVTDIALDCNQDHEETEEPVYVNCSQCSNPNDVVTLFVNTQIEDPVEGWKNVVVYYIKAF